MANPNPNQDNLKPFKQGEDERRGEGRAKGSRNRSTVARELLEAMLAMPEGKTKDYLTKLGLDTSGDAEKLMTSVQIAKSIISGDTKAYQAIMDSAHGAPKNQTEHTGEIKLPVTGMKVE